MIRSKGQINVKSQERQNCSARLQPRAREEWHDLKRSHYTFKAQMTKIECAPQYPPLKIRGVRGVMRGEVMEVTPCYPPYSKGELGKRGVVLTFRHSDFVWPLDFDIWILPRGLDRLFGECYITTKLSDL
jgi:hypothetical protein